MITAYPLTWPSGWPITPAGAKVPGKFGTMKQRQGQHWDSRHDITLTDATARVLAELDRMGIERQDVIISTNVVLRLDGLPRSGQPAPRDPGAAVYWQTRNGGRLVMAIDQYTKVEQNLAAIAATLDAMRAIERHGGAQILARAFTGFAALPAPAAGRTWREVFGFTPNSRPTHAEMRAQYRALASARHPDKHGGNNDAMAELNAAKAAAEAELGISS